MPAIVKKLIDKRTITSIIEYKNIQVLTEDLANNADGLYKGPINNLRYGAPLKQHESMKGEEIKSMINDFFKKSAITKPFPIINSVVGATPSVPRFLNGEPKQMLLRKVERNADKAVKIYFNIANMTVPEEWMVSEIALFFATVLENVQMNSKERFEIYALRSTRFERESDGREINSFHSVLVKPTNQKYSNYRHSFPLRETVMFKMMANVISTKVDKNIGTDYGVTNFKTIRDLNEWDTLNKMEKDLVELKFLSPKDIIVSVDALAKDIWFPIGKNNIDRNIKVVLDLLKMDFDREGSE